MIIVEGSARIEAGDWEKVRPAMEKMIRASRREAGCLDYAYAIDLLDPGQLRIIERWADRAALAAHFATPHRAEFRAALAEAFPRELSVRMYEAEPEPLPLPDA